MQKGNGKYILVAVIIVLAAFELTGQAQDKDSSFVKFYYPNGQVSSEGIMRNNRPDGYWKTYYVTGVVKSEGKRTNFLLDSIWNFYNQSGELIQQISYKIGSKSGYSIRYRYDNPLKPGQRTVVSKELYINDKKEGKSYYYYPTGELKQVVIYKNGRKHGLSMEYDVDSTLITVLEYNNNYVVDRERVNRVDKSGEKQGIFREYYASGQIKKEVHYLDNQLHGYYREFDGNGNLITAVRYERGNIVEEIDEDIKELLDMKSTYDEQGRIIFTGGYKNGIPVGVHRFYDTTGAVQNSYLYNELGQKISEGIIDEQGRRTGSWTDYYPTGEIKAKGFYKSSMRTGKWTFYYRAGGIEQTGRYERGKYSGKWIWYYPNGNVWREENYFNGREDGNFVEYARDGTILTKGAYINGEKEGEWIYQVGDHIERGVYQVGLREGEWKYYYNNGNLEYEGYYYQGNPHKKHKYYYPSGVLKEEQYYEMGIREKNWKKYDQEGNLVMTITYKNNQEQRINGIKIRLPENDVTLIR